MASKKPTAKDVINQVLDRPLVFVDWRSLPLDLRKQWGGDALSALKNRAVQALIGRSGLIGEGEATTGEIVKDCIEHIARGASTFEEVNNMRMTINGMELIRQLLEEMLYNEQKQTNEDPHSPI